MASTAATLRDHQIDPEDTRASCVRSGREYLGNRRLADSCLTGSQHDLSASAERAIKRTAQL